MRYFIKKKHEKKYLLINIYLSVDKINFFNLIILNNKTFNLDNNLVFLFLINFKS